MKRDEKTVFRGRILKTAFLLLVFSCITLLLGILIVLAQNNQDVLVSIRQIDKSSFPTLDVYVSVVDNQGQPIRGVTTSSFSLFENGFPIENIAMEVGKAPVITILAIDRSGSMRTASKMQGAQDAASTFVNLLRSGDSVGLVAFNEQAGILQELTDDRDTLIEEIQSVSPDGKTAFFDALWIALERLDPIAGRKSIILLTDGLDNESKHTAEEIIEFSKSANIPIYTIGLGDNSQDPQSDAWIDEGLLTSIAQGSGGFYSLSPTADELTDLYALLSEQMQNEYKLSYLSPSVDQDGSNRQIVVVVTLAGKSFEAMGRYNPGGVIPVVQTEPEAYWGPFALALAILLTLLLIPRLVNGARVLFTSDTKAPAATMPPPTTSGDTTGAKIKLGPITSPDMLPSTPRAESAIALGREPETPPASHTTEERPRPRIRFRDAEVDAVSRSPDSATLTTEPKRSRPRIRLGSPDTMSRSTSLASIDSTDATSEGLDPLADAATASPDREGDVDREREKNPQNISEPKVDTGSNPAIKLSIHTSEDPLHSKKGMTYQSVVLVLPDGSTRHTDLPDNVPIRELLIELVDTLSLNRIGPDGRLFGYRVHSKRLGRHLEDSETLASAEIPLNDHLVLIIDITAGGGLPVRSFKEIQLVDAVLNNDTLIHNLDGMLVFAVFLYTEEDERLASYIRDHVYELHQMSGHYCMFFVIEQPTPEWRQEARRSLEIVAGEHSRTLWDRLRTDSFQPFDKSQAYSIGRRFGVTPRQFPCIVLFAELKGQEVEVIEINEFVASDQESLDYEYTKFFRILFSVVEQIVTQPYKASRIPRDEYLVQIGKLLAREWQKVTKKEMKPIEPIRLPTLVIEVIGAVVKAIL